MTFNKDLPAGNEPIAKGDDDIRANNTALQAAMDLEHDFVDADGAQQTGSHKFQIDLQSAIEALGSRVDGAIGFANDPSVREGRPRLMVKDSVLGWVLAEPGGDFAPYLDAANSWQELQIAPQVTPALDTQNQHEVKWEDGSYQIIGGPVSGDFTFAGVNDASMPSNASGVITIEFINAQNGLVINWGTDFVAPNGIAPAYGTQAGQVTVFQLQRINFGVKWLVTSAPSVGAF